jgi:hypothetical protein
MAPATTTMWPTVAYFHGPCVFLVQALSMEERRMLASNFAIPRSEMMDVDRGSVWVVTRCVRRGLVECCGVRATGLDPAQPWQSIGLLADKDYPLGC